MKYKIERVSAFPKEQKIIPYSDSGMTRWENNDPDNFCYTEEALEKIISRNGELIS